MSKVVYDEQGNEVSARQIRARDRLRAERVEQEAALREQRLAALRDEEDEEERERPEGKPLGETSVVLDTRVAVGEDTATVRQLISLVQRLAQIQRTTREQYDRCPSSEEVEVLLEGLEQADNAFEERGIGTES